MMKRKYIATEPIIEGECEGCCFGPREYICTRPVIAPSCRDQGRHKHIYIVKVFTIHPNITVI
jgi:hypothetical protein